MSGWRCILGGGAFLVDGELLGGGLFLGGCAFARVPTKEDEARLTLEEEALRAARSEAADAKEEASRASALVEKECQTARTLDRHRWLSIVRASHCSHVTIYLSRYAAHRASLLQGTADR